MIKRNFSRVLSCILALVMLISIVPVQNISAASVEISDTGATLDNGFWYEIQDGEAVITDYTSNATELVIPAELGGCPVTAIGEGAFLYCTTLKSVVIPDGVTSIGDRAFANCMGLESVEIPNSVTSMGTEVFTDCYYLENVILSESISEIPDNAFNNCYSLSSVVIPEGVTNIGEYAFYYCDALESVTLPSSLTTISEYAFDCCLSLAEVYFTGTQEQWEQIIFEGYNTYLLDATINYDDNLSTEPAEHILIYFADSLNWSDISLYYDCYNDEDSNRREMELDYVNEYGENVYIQSVPADADVIYFTSADGKRTVFITSFSDGVCYYCTDEIAVGVYSVDVFDESESNEPLVEYVISSPFESEHNYGSDMDKTWIIEEEGASFIILTFSEDTNVEEGWDYICIYDGNDELIGEYTGNALAAQVISVYGSIAQVQLISDSSNEYYGFYAEYEVVYDENTDPTEPSQPEDKSPDYEYLYSIDVDSTYRFPVIEGFYTITFCTGLWDNPMLYVWNDDYPMTSWPGVDMKFIGNNEYNENVFISYIPEEYCYFIINNGEGSQTVDLEISGNVAMYLSDEQSDGKYAIGTWNAEYYDHIADNTDPTEPEESEPVETDPTEPSQPEDTTPPAYNYCVVFVDYNNAFIEVQMVEAGMSATAPESPSRSGYTFVGWDTEFDCVTENLTVKAVYEKNATPPSPAITTGTLSVEVAGGNGFTISIDGGVARPQGSSYMNSKMPIGAKVTVVANSSSGAEFVGWMDSTTGVLISTDKTCTFVASGRDSIKAVFTIAVSGVKSVTFKNTKSGSYGRILDSQYYSANDTISFPADPTQVGFDFAGWSMTEAEIKEAIAKGKNVEVVANWTRQIVPVQIEVIGGEGSGSYIANSAVTVVANEAPQGEKFAYWTDAQGNIKSYSETYKFFPSCDVTLTAVYVSESESINYQILVTVDTIDTTSIADKNVFYYSWYVPTEYDFVKSGILAVNKDNYNESTFVPGTTDSNVYDRTTDGVGYTHENSTAWTKSKVTQGQTWVAKAYIQYRDANGELVTVYSDIVEATKD